MARLRPYLVRATYDWLVDHNLTPYFLVDAEQDGVEVPWEYVEDGKIVLNAAPIAIRNLQLENDFVGFEASFSGKTWQIFFPVEATLALYARETGQGIYAREEGLGMLVNEGEADELDPLPPEDGHKTEKPATESTDKDKNKKGRGKGGLKLVK